MRRVLIPLAVAFCVLTAVPLTAATGDTPKGKTVREDDDKKGEKKSAGEKGEQRKGKGPKLPKAVAEAVKSIFPGMKVMKSEEKYEDSEVVYAVTLHDKRGTLEAKLTPKGRVVEVEIEGDDEDEGKPERKGEKENEKAKSKEKDDERGEKGKEKNKEKEDDKEENKGKKKDKDD